MISDFCSYNIWGLNKKQSFTKDFLSFNKFSLFALLETHVKEDFAGAVSKFLCPRFSWEFNYDHHYNGRIWVGWDPDIWKLAVLSSSAQHISCSVQRHSTGETFVVSFIYGFNTVAERRILWDELIAVQSSFRDDLPWCLIGDFNVCMEPSETNSTSSWNSSMSEFRDLVAHLGVTDLSYTGLLFTWWDCNINSPTYKKLDRCLVNGAWLHSFSLSQAKILTRGISDHCPISVSLGVTWENSSMPFQFFNHLIMLHNFLDEIRSAWHVNVIGNPWIVLTSKLRRVKDAMRKLNASKGNLHSAVLEARSNLLGFQSSLPLHPSSSQFQEEDRLIQILQKTLHLEEVFLKQKSRVNWLKNGDGNNRFFFNACKGRWNSNKILSIEDDLGNIHTSHKDISRVATQFFSSLFGQAHEVMDLPLDLYLPQVSHEQKEELSRPFSPTDVWTTLKNMAKNKSPGPDGFTVEFYLASWDIIGEDVTKGVIHFFESKYLPRIICSTAISLIPKQQPATTMSDFRPIACCNVLFKCITKMLAIGLKKILPTLISPYQSAFVPKRLIGDNILLAQSLCKNYHLDSGQPRCAIKVDLKKAFDTLNWRFPSQVLQRMGFPTVFIDWFMICIRSCMISLKINGSLEGFFKAQSGLRQGDPMSPYLFVIAMEVLTACLAKTTASPDFKHHWQTKKLSITHITFADDVLLFCYGNEPSINLLMEGVRTFSSISGLQPNQSKSSCFFSSMKESVIQHTLEMTGFQRGCLPIKYLGLPLLSTQLYKRDCNALIG